MNIRDFQRMIPRIQESIRLQMQVALTEVAEKIAEDAKSYIGHEQDNWPPLADTTIKSKEAKGEETPDPLLATGALRDSIKVHVEMNHAVIGTDEKEAVYLETGTSKMPPRPFMSKALMANMETAEVIFSEALKKVQSSSKSK